MMLHVFALAVLGIGVDLLATDFQTIEGVVVNGTLGEAPVAGAEVILRAGQDSSLLPVAQARTDENGRFVFEKVPVEPGVVFLPGANRGGVHYPGPRFQLQPGAPNQRVKLTVYDTVAAPSPLVAERHEIDLHIQAGVLEVTETLLVHNPTLTTYVGDGSKMGPTTLTLAIPESFERVTFHKEFHGRRFQVIDGRLVTDIPWTPGQRELKFTYHLPVGESQQLLERPLDLPCSLVRIRVRGKNADQVVCNLPQAAGDGDDALVFASSGATLPAGHPITLQLGGLSAPWIVQARWAAIVLLGGLILVTAYLLRMRKKSAETQLPEGGSDTRQRVPRQSRKRRALRIPPNRP